MPHGDICDILAGRYPKSFVWTGWHPNDLCYVTPIMKAEDEFFGDSETSVNEVTDVPEAFKEWVRNNEDRILAARERGTEAYFLRDNKELVDGILQKAPQVKTATKQEISEFVKSQKYGKEVEDNLVGIIYKTSLRSPAEAQHYLHQINQNISHSVFDYSKKYMSNKEVVALLKVIKRIEYKDEIRRNRLINKLKNVCAEESKKELYMWGKTKGLTFLRFEKNFTVSKEETYSVNGTSVKIPHTSCDLIIYRDEYGRKFAYPVGAGQTIFSAIEASKIIHNFPPYLRHGIKQVTFLNQNNPYDEYWKLVYNNPNHVSIATDGGKTTFYLTPDVKDFGGYMAHEAGHIIDGNKHKFSTSKAWFEAVAKDDEIYKGKPVRNRVSEYANTNDSEDFAECIREYITAHDFFKECFPNRAAYIRNVAKKLTEKLASLSE